MKNCLNKIAIDRSIWSAPEDTHLGGLLAVETDLALLDGLVGEGDA